VFVIDPELPDGIRNITLSYTFFEIGAAAGKASAPAIVSPPSATGAQTL
jgi:cytochrome c oxidase assembly protein subunit 11